MRLLIYPLSHRTTQSFFSAVTGNNAISSNNINLNKMIAAVVMITTLFGAKAMRHLGQTGRSHFSIEELKDVFDITSLQVAKEFAKIEREIEETKKKDIFDGLTKPSKN